MDDEEKRIRKNEYGKRWYQKNKKKIKENRSKYYQENKEKYKEYCKEYGKKYRQKNKEKLKEYWKEYGKEYRQKNRNRNREWGEIAQIALLHMMPCCTWRTYNERELDEELERIMGLTLPNTNVTTGASRSTFELDLVRAGILGKFGFWAIWESAGKRGKARERGELLFPFSPSFP